MVCWLSALRWVCVRLEGLGEIGRALCYRDRMEGKEEEGGREGADAESMGVLSPRCEWFEGKGTMSTVGVNSIFGFNRIRII